MQSWMKDLMVWWCWSSSSSFPGLKGDELQNMLFWLGGNWEFLQVEREKELRKRLLRSEDPWLTGKSRPQGLAQNFTSSHPPHPLRIYQKCRLQGRH